MPVVVPRRVRRRPAQPERNLMHIEMLKTELGSRDGRVTERFFEGETYEVPDELADIFIDEGWAEEVDAPEPAPDEENNDVADDVALEDLDDEQLAAKVLELDPEADPAAVAQAIADDRDAVLAALKEHEPTVDDLDGKTKKELLAIADEEKIEIPSRKASNAILVEAIKAARAAKQET